jgi:hypothetical protein
MAIEEQDIDPRVIEGQEQIAQQEDSLMNEFSPSGSFSKKSLNALVKVAKQLQPLFGLKADYPEFTEDVEYFPTEFTRLLMMYKQAVDDAIAMEVIDEDKTFILDDVSDDNSVQVIAGKLGAVVKDKAFKKFLSAPPTEVEEVKEETVDEERTPVPEEMDSSIDELFGGRL